MKGGKYRITRDGEFVRCPWHGWEFDVKTGQSYCDPNDVKIKSFAVTIEPGERVVKGPYVAETFPVSIDGDYIVVEV